MTDSKRVSGEMMTVSLRAERVSVKLTGDPTVKLLRPRRELLGELLEQLELLRKLSNGLFDFHVFPGESLLLNVFVGLNFDSLFDPEFGLRELLGIVFVGLGPGLRAF